MLIIKSLQSQFIVIIEHGYEQVSVCYIGTIWRTATVTDT